MITQQLINPQSIAVVGGSNNINKPGGQMVKNILTGGFAGKLYIVNPKETKIQGIKVTPSVHDLPQVDMGVLAVASSFCKETVDVLVHQKGAKAIIIISSGFSEETPEGGVIEKKIQRICSQAGVSLIGPNCIGLANRYHHSVFTAPVPEFHPNGADLISASGGVALFIMECAIPKGLRFNSIWSVGNASQIGIEAVLEYMDEHYNPEEDSKIKLLYIENIKDPDKLLYHASSLIRKGCKIAAIKSGCSESGMRAASSHTGALASSDSAVEALFRKAGIVRCYSREELATVACVFTLKDIHGKNFAVVTHAGGPAVILTDALSRGGLGVPAYQGKRAEELKSRLLPGSSVSNPIDILGTGSAADLGLAIDYADQHFPETDAIATIFGSTGLGKISDALEMIRQKSETCTKPVFPILPSIVNSSKEVEDFIRAGGVNFSDEVALASAVSRVVNTPKPTAGQIELQGVDIPLIRRTIDRIDENGYLQPSDMQILLKAAGLAMVEECVSTSEEEVLAFARQTGFPVVAKVVGPVHKTDIGGVALNIKTEEHLSLEFRRMMKLPGVRAVMIQPMLKGTELFIGAKYEDRFGHIVLCGLGGIFVEVLGDVASGLAPLEYEEAYSMIRSLRAYKIFKGTRGQKGVNEHQFAEFIVRLSTLLRFATEIKELDLNPLLATEKGIIAVDARIRVEK